VRAYRFLMTGELTNQGAISHIVPKDVVLALQYRHQHVALALQVSHCASGRYAAGAHAGAYVKDLEGLVVAAAQHLVGIGVVLRVMCHHICASGT